MRLKHEMDRSPSNQQGFSLLELIVVLAGLGILSSLAIPNYMKYLDYAKVDEAKALLNSAAADCLQALRNGEVLNSTVPDPARISDVKLKSFNYRIKESNKNCSNFQIEPYINNESLAGKHLILFTLGFRFEVDKFGSDKLVKVATKEAAENTRACESWAGINCGFSDPEAEAKWNNYYEHLSQIQEAKSLCLSTASQKLKGPPPYTGKYETWVTTGDARCKDDPPNIPSTGCEIESCNQINFAKDGQPLAGEEALKAALCTEWLQEIRDSEFTTPYPPFNPTKDLKNNCPENPDFWFVDGIDQGSEQDFKEKLCSNWIESIEQRNPPFTNDPLSDPVTSTECGDQEFWFIDGVDYKNKTDFDARLLETASGKCAAEREEARESGFTGKWGPKEGPGVCAEESYICDKKIVSEYDFYRDCKQKAPEKCKKFLKKEDKDCTDYELSDYWYKKCKPRPNDCRQTGMGRPGHKNGWDKTKECSNWAKCMELY